MVILENPNNVQQLYIIVNCSLIFRCIAIIFTNKTNIIIVLNLSQAGKSFVKIKIFGIYFMCLVGYLGMFRKSQEVWARNFDPKGVNASRKPNPGTLCPPPRVIGLSLFWFKSEK